MNKIRIAIADDTNLFRSGVVAILKNDDQFEIVGEAANGAILIDQIAVMKSPPDLCILDIQMPEKDGYQTLTELKALYPTIKFLMLTTFFHEFVVIKCLKLGAN